MLKHLLNSSCPTSLMLWDANSDTAAAEEKAKLREQLSKGNVTNAESPIKEEDIIDEKEEDEEEGEEDDEEEEVVDPPAEETAEEKTVREKKEKEDFRAKRKEDRVQKRIDTAIAAQKAALDEVAKWKAIAEAKPADEKLTEEEVQRRADAIATEKIANNEVETLQKTFNKNCDIIQEKAIKIDKDFYPKVHALAGEIGPLPTSMLNELFDMEDGPDILVYLANDVDEAERIYDLQNKPAKLGRELGKISDKLAEEKKPKKKEISKVPDPMTPVNGNRVQSSQIVAKDYTPEGMDNYVRKRQLQIEARRKQGR